jgi:hypothetical protein
MDNIKVIRAETGPAGVKSKFDVYFEGKFVMSVRAFTPQLAKKDFLVQLSERMKWIEKSIAQGNRQ